VQSRFRIEEMVYQDETGVVFRGWDTARELPVAIRRFFLPEAILKKLAEKKHGRTLLSLGIEELQGLSAPKLRKVVSGGFDEVDGTPYLVTEWWEGQSLRTVISEQQVQGNDRAQFLKQAGELVDALPEKMEELLGWSEEDVVLERTSGGGTIFSFWICARSFFSRQAGDSKETIAPKKAMMVIANRLVSSGSAPLVTSAGIPTQSSQRPEPLAEAPKPVLKSAQSGGGGKLVGLLVLALLSTLAVVGYILVKQSGSEVASTAETSVRQEVIGETQEDLNKIIEEEFVEESSLAEVEEVPAAQPLRRESESVAEHITEADPEETEFEAQVAMNSASEPVVEVVEEVLEEPLEEEKIIEQSSFVTEEAFSPQDLEGLRTKKGEEIQIRGFVGKVAKSGGKGAWWYLEFGNYREEAFGVFKHQQSQEGADWVDWESFVGQEVLVTAKVELGGRGFKNRGSNVRLLIREMSSVVPIEELAEEKKNTVYGVDEFWELRELLDAEDEVKVKGTLARLALSLRSPKSSWMPLPASPVQGPPLFTCSSRLWQTAALPTDFPATKHSNLPPKPFSEQPAW